MLFSDTYKIVEQSVTAELKEKGSRFVATVFAIQNEEEAKHYLLLSKKEHPSANHHCYAYVLGSDSLIQKSTDDREPSNTAGKPILRAITAKQLTYTMVIVVRYFGGKLLGVSGLIQAYGGAAILALDKATCIEKILSERHEWVYDFEHENEVFKLVKLYNLKIVDFIHAEKITLIFDVRKSEAVRVLESIHKKRLFHTTFISQQ